MRAPWGGVIGGALARAGFEVTLVARGAHLEAMRAHGLRLTGASGDYVVHPRLAATPSEAGPQDFVVLTLKAPAVLPIVDLLQPMLEPDTAIVTAMNGMPWWYFHAHGGRFDGHRLRTLDPDGRQWEALGPNRMIGAVLWLAGSIVAPGVVRHAMGDSMPIGEPDGSRSKRSVVLSEALEVAGFKAPVVPNIRDEIWAKLWGNLSFNPVSALTHGTMQDLARDPGSARVLMDMMREAQAIAESLGVRFKMGVTERFQMSERVGPHQTSTLQDLLAGRPMEIEALLGAVVELADLTGLPGPTLRVVYDLVSCRARMAKGELQ